MGSLSYPNSFLVCSKTIWLGHLSKSTTEDRLARELIDIIAPPAHSSNNNTEYYQEKKKSLIVNLDVCIKYVYYLI